MTPDWAGGQIFKFAFWGQSWVSLDLSQREKHEDVKFIVVGQNNFEVVEKRKV